MPIGKAKIERVGEHVTIIAFSIMVGTALKAAETLAEQGIERRGYQPAFAAPA